MENCLEPFFKQRIMNSILEIQQINKAVISTLKPVEKSNLPAKETLIEEPEIIQCDKCDFDTLSANLLRKHIINDHSKNIFQGLSINTPNIQATETNHTVGNSN